MSDLPRGRPLCAQYNEFFKPEEIGARQGNSCKQGRSAPTQLASGQAPWATATGLVVRGYVSKIDKSVQPYGLVVPPSYSPTRAAPLAPRRLVPRPQRDPERGEFPIATASGTPANSRRRDTIVLHLYGRYCNANKLAGEVDFFEALDAVKRQYPIDENRIAGPRLQHGRRVGLAYRRALRRPVGGGRARAPASARRRSFSRSADAKRSKPAWWEQKLWHLYDATDYAVNFFNIAAGGLQRRDRWAEAGRRHDGEGHGRGGHAPDRAWSGRRRAHRYHPDSKVEIDRMLDAIAARGRDPYPRKVRFTTWTLAYNQMKWVTVDALGKHWERARLDAEIAGDHAVAVRRRRT